MAPTLSIVLPMFNVEHYLDPCLRSLLDQKVEDIEIVVVDDGSTDSSAAISQKWAREDRRIRMFSQENTGLSGARNAGVREARGRFLAFCDSDDLVPPNGYALLIESLESTGSDIASGDVRRIDSGGLYPHDGYEDAFARDRRRTHIRRDMGLVRDRMVWNKVFRRSFWDANDLFFTLPAYEDAPVMIRAHIEASSVDVLSEVVYYWRIRELGGPSMMQRMREPAYVAACMRSVVDTFAVMATYAPELVPTYADDMCRRDVRNALRSLHLHDDDTLSDAVWLARSFVAGVPDSVLRDLPESDRRVMELLARGDLDGIRLLVDPPS